MLGHLKSSFSPRFSQGRILKDQVYSGRPSLGPINNKSEFVQCIVDLLQVSIVSVTNVRINDLFLPRKTRNQRSPFLFTRRTSRGSRSGSSRQRRKERRGGRRPCEGYFCEYFGNVKFCTLIGHRYLCSFGSLRTTCHPLITWRYLDRLTSSAFCRLS